MSLTIQDGAGWPEYTTEDIKYYQELLDGLASEYGSQKNGGLSGAVGDGKISQQTCDQLRTFIEWENA